MLSPKQKKALFGASIESRPRYVRVPLQMVNSVRELNTDVNFARLVAQFEQTDDRLRSSTTEPIAHIRLDASGVRGWADFYDRYCSAYRALNGSRIIRRMRVTGYRMINISCRSTGYDVVTDSYVRGIDEACVILDMLVRSILSSGRIAVTIETDGTTLQTNRLRSAIVSHDEWRRSWTLERCIAPAGQMILRADRSEIVEALNLCLNLASSLVHSVSFLGSCIALDFQPMEHHTLKQRYEYLDLNVLLSGRRLRRVQRFGQSRGYDGTGIIPIGRMEASSRCSQFYPDFKEIVGKVTNGHQRVPPL